MSTYNVVITAHGLCIIFIFLMPALFAGFGTYFVPICIGSSDVVYPRINAVSHFLVPLRSILVMQSIIPVYGSGMGWTMCPPLSSSLMTLDTESVDWITTGLGILGISNVLGCINFLGTTLFLRSVSGCIPHILYIWAIIFAAMMLIYIVTLPILTGGLVVILMGLRANSESYDSMYSGSSV